MMTDIKQSAVQQVTFMRWYQASVLEGPGHPAFVQVNYTHPDGHTVKTDMTMEYNAETAALVESIAAMNGLVDVEGGPRVWGEWHVGANTFVLQGWEAPAQQLPESICDDGSIAVEDAVATLEREQPGKKEAVAQAVEGGVNVSAAIAHQLHLNGDDVFILLCELEKDGRIHQSSGGYWEPTDEKLLSALAQEPEGRDSNAQEE